MKRVGQNRRRCHSFFSWLHRVSARDQNQLLAQQSKWDRLVEAIALVMQPTEA